MHFAILVLILLTSARVYAQANQGASVAGRSDEEVAAEFFPLSKACAKAVSSNAPNEAQAAACRKAADVADQFSPQERFLERRSAFIYAAAALHRNKQNQASLLYADKAVAVGKQGHDDYSGAGAAYGVRAQAKARLGDLAGASEDLTKAEALERSAIQSMLAIIGMPRTRGDLPVLEGMLRLHAQIFTMLGKPEEAALKTREAEKVKSTLYRSIR